MICVFDVQSNCKLDFNGLSPASKVSREVANLTERKNLHTPVYGVKEFVRLSGIIFFLLSKGIKNCNFTH